MASTFYENELSVKERRKFEDLAQDESHDYPLRGNKHINPIGINLEPVQMFMRTKNDFDHPDRFKDVDAPPPKTITNYEAYLTKE